MPTHHNDSSKKHHNHTNHDRGQKDAASGAKAKGEKGTSKAATPLIVAGAVAVVAGASGALYVLERRREARRNRLLARVARVLTSAPVKALATALMGSALTALAAKTRTMIAEH
ncbi:MAG: hypothetical protein U0414_16180 [Polyangiaceae bacterium]